MAHAMDSHAASISGTTASVHEITVQHQDGQGQGLAKHTWESHSVWLTVPFPRGCKEVKPVSPKGNQSWVFFGRTDVEAETPVLSQLMRKADSFEKTLMLGKTEGGRRG